MARLVLVGLPGSGKSTLARAIAATLDTVAVDTDDAIEDLVGLPAAQFLRERGEAAFRDRELMALRTALLGDVVVATGAGVVTTPGARALLEAQCTLWLDSDDETLLTRVGEGDRPLLGADHRTGLAELRARREAWYAEVARARVDTTGPLDQVAARVMECARSVAT